MNGRFEIRSEIITRRFGFSFRQRCNHVLRELLEFLPLVSFCCNVVKCQDPCETNHVCLLPLCSRSFQGFSQLIFPVFRFKRHFSAVFIQRKLSLEPWWRSVKSVCSWAELTRFSRRPRTNWLPPKASSGKKRLPNLELAWRPSRGSAPVQTLLGLLQVALVIAVKAVKMQVRERVMALFLIKRYRQ